VAIQEQTSKAIVSGFETWINEATRAASGELDFGAWWRSNYSYWQVAWIEATRELYAAELGTSDRFLCIGLFEKRDVIQIMRLWHDGDNLGMLVQRLTGQPIGE
jgi:hypothetical protein